MLTISVPYTLSVSKWTLQENNQTPVALKVDLTVGHRPGGGEAAGLLLLSRFHRVVSTRLNIQSLPA
jgi:hypothetical protein